jgi:sugar lactone lactonase YvrE
MVTPTIAGCTIDCVVRAGDILGETPLWCDRSQKLWWVDIERRLQQSFDPATGAHEIFHHDCRFLGSHALTSDGSHLLAKDLAVFRRSAATGSLALLASVEHGQDNRLNDGRVDGRGCLWIGTMDNALHRPQWVVVSRRPRRERDAHPR